MTMTNCVQRGAVSKNSRSLITFCFLAFFMLTALVSAYGAGGRDQDLIRADALITDRYYEEATSILIDFIQRHPDRFDDAQIRFRRINQIREEFTRIADELLISLLYDPDNDERHLELSNQLFALERETSPLLINFMLRAREIAQFNINRNLLRDIFERGREWLDLGDGVSAILTYAEGMDFMRLEFFEAGFGAGIESRVVTETERINRVLANFQQVSSQMEVLSAELISSINAGDLNRVTQSANNFITAIDAFTVMKHELYTTTNVFSQIAQELHEIDPYMGDRNHVAFLSAIIHGRAGEPIQEGMLGAFDVVWKTSVGASLNVFLSYLEGANSAALAAIQEGNLADAALYLSQLQSFYNLTGQFFNRHTQFFEGEPAQLAQSAQPAETVVLFGNTILTKDMTQYLELYTVNQANTFLLQGVNAALRQNIEHNSLTNWQQGIVTTDAALTSERQVRNIIISTQEELENITANAEAVNIEINELHESFHLTNVITAVNSIHSVFLQEELLSVNRYYSIVHNNLRNTIDTRNSQIAVGINFLDGETRTTEDGAVITYRYPTEAFEVFSPLIPLMTQELQANNILLTQFRNEPPRFTANNEIAYILGNYETAIDEFTALLNETIALAGTANTRLNQALAYRHDGERLFAEAQAASQRQDFTLARSLLIDSTARMFNSLAIQADDEFTASWDTRALGLGHAISTTENEMIIAEVRELLNTANALFFAQNFHLAEETAERAGTRWLVTNQEQNQEVLRLLGLIRTAIAAGMDRSIPPTAPQFPVMSQLQNLAQQNYEEGVRYINAGQRDLGLERFETALQQTRDIRLLFPLNEAASILELRIEQFRDPPVFNAGFQQRLDTAFAGTREQSPEAWADLQNLRVINPGHPNMAAIIMQGEVYMGLRPPPPSPEAVARSNALTANVNRILNENLTVLFDSALVEIDEAIMLNPGNAQATITKDRLVSRMTIPDTIVFSAADEEIFQQAQREYLAGNTIIAWNLVQRLMANPQNQNITRLVDLHRRIRIQLGL